MNIQLKCQRCGWMWTYTGKNSYVVACPHCKTSVMVKTKEVAKCKD